MAATHCLGFMMFFSRALDRKQYGEMLRAIQDNLNDELDAEKRRYLLVPEKISEGGILVKNFPGRDPENQRSYKTMRHWLQKSIGDNISPYPWPLVGITNEEVLASEYPWKDVGVSEEEALEDWIDNGEGVALIPEGAIGDTRLKAIHGAPVWTLYELRIMANVMESGYGIKCTRFPKPLHLCMHSAVLDRKVLSHDTFV
jgi:hypothetical protein